MIDMTILAYLAGTIDSDGYVCIRRSTYRSGRARFEALVGICGTRTEPHKLAASVFGGPIRSYVNRSSAHRLMHVWQPTGARAVRVLDAVLPFLRIKTRQAELAIEAQIVATQQRQLCADFTDQLEDLHREIKSLNQWRREVRA